MRKLQLKPEFQDKTGKPAGGALQILSSAREQLSAIIGDGVKRLFLSDGSDEPDFANGEEYVLNLDDFDCRAVLIHILVEDPRTSCKAIEKRNVVVVKVALDGAVFVQTENEEGDCVDGDIPLDELSLGDVGDLALQVEQTLKTIDKE